MAPADKVTSTSAQDRIKRVFEDKDWKFYCAVAAGIVLAGAGAYYLTSTSTPKAKKREMQKKPEEKKKESETSASKKAAETAAVDYESMTDEAILGLTEEQRGDAAQALKTKGNSQFSSRKYAEAVELYTQAIRFKKDPIFFSNRAACFANLGQNERVIEDCNEALKLDPVYVKALNRRAQALEKKGQLSDSLYDFTCVCILDGFKNETAAKSMERLLKQVSETKAKEMMKVIQAKKPHLPSPTFVTAYLDSFRPVTPDLSSITDEESGDAYYAKAYRAVANKDYETAVEACERAVTLGCSRAYQALALNMYGTFVFLKGNTKDALEYFNKAIEADPKFVQSYIKRSSIFMEQGDVPSTFKQFEEAIAINPSDPDIYYHRGQGVLITMKDAKSVLTKSLVNYISGNYDAAAKDYSESIKLDDSFVYAHIQLGVVQYKLGSISSSMTTFNNTLKKFPNSADVHNYYGELLADQQKLPDAIDMFSKAVAMDPKNPLPYINKAMLMYQVMGDINEATALCKTALEADPACDAAVASLAQILLEQGKPEEALKYYELAIELARTEAELEHAISYVEATKTQIKFAQEYPEAAANLKASRGQ
ncbi:TOM (translocase of outer membrane) complex component [Apophysomyces ossiformis]|uniref:TOM (Translocase of outer membrane) complex component n=1 Tax=Apophysomyces ossiformis TaxID=679940 RepID=A0A8H7C0G2_9FUNG|nr:TOM (translocase of outer membrane) complex component [Apophysomyces ossiformis]